MYQRKECGPELSSSATSNPDGRGETGSKLAPISCSSHQGATATCDLQHRRQKSALLSWIPKVWRARPPITAATCPTLRKWAEPSRGIYVHEFSPMCESFTLQTVCVCVCVFNTTPCPALPHNGAAPHCCCLSEGKNTRTDVT